MNTTNTAIHMQKQRAAGMLQNNCVDDARKILTGVCSQAKKDAEAWDMLGAANSMLGLYSEAEKCFQRVIKLSPGNCLAHNNLGSTLRAQGKRKQALSQYDKALRINPGYATAHFNRGGVLQELGEVDAALASHQRALQLAPHDAGIHSSLAQLFRDRRDLDSALKHYQEALRITPGLTDAVISIADIYKTKKQHAEAFAVLEPYIQGDPAKVSVKVALSYARLCRHTDRYDDGIDLLERMKAGAWSVLPESDRAGVCFGLGDLYDARGDYRNAFANFELGNQLRLGPDVSDAASSEELRLRETLAVFTPQFLEQVPRARNTSEAPVFIIGMPRSGTSLVEQILCSHPDIYGAGELELLGEAADQLWKMTGSKLPYPKYLPGITQAQVDSAANSHLDKLRKLAGGEELRITDKMPGNYWYLGLIYLLFPKAHVIHCMRDPLDTCLSIYFQNFAVAHEYTNDLKSIGRVYAIYRQLMAYWIRVLKYPILNVHYEDLVENQESVTRRLVEFCDLPWDEKCLRFQDNQRMVLTASHDQVRRAIYTSSRQRWKNYQEFIGDLVDELNNAGIVDKRAETATEILS